MGFPRQEYWSGLSFPPPWDLPNPGIERRSSALAGWFHWATWEDPIFLDLPPNRLTKAHILSQVFVLILSFWDVHSSYSFDAKSNKPNVFNYRRVSGGWWLEDTDNIQCFFSSFLASELYLRDPEPGCMGEDGTKAGGVVRRDKTRHVFTRQIFTGHPHRPHRDLGVKDNRQIKQDPWFFRKLSSGGLRGGKDRLPSWLSDRESAC